MLPVLDISSFIDDPRSPEAARFATDLRDVCHGIGFAHIIGHGISPALESDLLETAQEFFALPVSARTDLAIENSAAFRGYTILGDENTAGGQDWRDQLDFGPEQAAPQPGDEPAYLRLRGPNQWPSALPRMAPIALEWQDAMTELGLHCLRALGSALDQPLDHFDRYFVPDSDVHTKIIRYPAGNLLTDQGVGRHHDSGLLTFILQGKVPGLQVEIGDSMVTVEPMPGAYVMNLGAMLQAATSGYLRATPHRVRSPEGEQDRLSVAFFFNPVYESTFEPIALPAALAQLAVPDLVDLKGEAIHTRFGENNLKVRLRSHPDVAARHYADVLAEQNPTSA